MARPISQAELERLDGEDDTRVLTKQRAAPKVIPVPKEAPKPVAQSAQTVDNSQLIDTLIKQHQDLIQAVQNIDVKPTIRAPEVIIDKARIDTIHIGNIERNGQNRIESLDMNVKYEVVH